MMLVSHTRVGQGTGSKCGAEAVLAWGVCVCRASRVGGVCAARCVDFTLKMRRKHRKSKVG
jgi:hypothetical protein